MKRRKNLTGADYILGMASSADFPYADRFARMAMDAATGPEPLSEGPLLSEVTASRPLREHEAAPVSIIDAAWHMATQDRNGRAAEEVVMFGLALLAKWPDYLVSMDMHPTLERKPTEGRS